ncbi:carbohydrate ABC transporter permease [Jiangella asiatica]|uniref:Sugar ABC transporter permease n=1 Tax=Jiangella asiatica TaxID=2530372 RepID=A0A4R5DJB1_9ACTN|nr:sugar ABC transporter permease [Jiangella asiatica]TDE14196.1 sugar ABC transporter permease [Jiangella asiatica]
MTSRSSSAVAEPAPAAADRRAPGPAARPRRRRGRVPGTVWVFLLLAGGVEAIWIFWPALSTFYFSLTSWDGLDAPRFIGLENFTSMARDDVFHTALRNNAVWLAGFAVGSVILGLAMAVALDRPRRGVGVYRALIYLPMVFSLLVTGLFWRVMYQPEGPVNAILAAIGLESWQRQWLADPDIVLLAVLVAAVWRQVGYVMVLYLAGLKATDPALADAARVDGCSAWQRFWHVTMPQLRGVNTVVAAITVIDALRTFDVVWSMTGGGPYNSSELLSTYMFRQAFTNQALGYSSAIAVVIFVLTLGFIVFFLRRSFAEQK